MENGLLLILLGLISYFLVKQKATKITKTPVGLLWLVMMMPAFIWTGWLILMGKDQPMPSLLLIIPLIVSPLLYLWLVQRQRIDVEKDVEKNIATPEKNLQILQINEELLEEDPMNKQIVAKTKPPISKSEETTLRNCFPWGVYYLQNIDYHPQGILCRGKLKTIPEEAYHTIRQNIEKAFGDRFIIVFQESFSGQPFFALVPNIWKQKTPEIDDSLKKPGLAIGLLLITLFTTTIIGVQLSDVAPEIIANPELILADPQLLLKGLPYSLGIMSILGIHEISHYLMAIYYRVKVTLPYFIPLPFFLGTIGAFIQKRSPFPHRKALFDTAIAGPLAGLLVTLPILYWGLTQSETISLEQAMRLREESSQWQLFNTFNPRFSLLTAVISKVALGSALGVDTYLDLHPLAIAGFIGLLITAFNLTPVGQLDGGHIIHGMFGQTQGAVIGQLTRILMFILALAQPPLLKEVFVLWAIILLLMPAVDQPALNDVTELDNKRDFLGLLSLFLLVSILLPLPVKLAQWLSF